METKDETSDNQALANCDAVTESLCADASAETSSLWRLETRLFGD